MVLFSKRPAGLNLLRPTGSVQFAVFCLLFDFFSLGVWGGRHRGGFCVLSLFSVCMDWLKSVIMGS